MAAEASSRKATCRATGIVSPRASRRSRSSPALVATGHLAETLAVADRRVRLVSRTPDGDAVLVRTAALMASLEDDWRTAVGPRRHATFRSVLEELSAAGTGSAVGSPPG